MPRFNSSTFGSYAGKWLMITAASELVFAAVLVTIGVLVREARFGMFLTGAILGLVGIGLLLAAMRSRERAASARRVLSTGIPGTATITGLAQTGMFLNENPQVEMDLMVQIPGRPSYAAKRKQFVPLILLGRLSSGAPLTVKVDPADSSNVEIDWDAPVPAPGTGDWWAAPAHQAGYTVELLRAYLRTNGLSGTATIDRLEDSGKVVGDDRLFIMQTTTNLLGHPPHKGGPTAALVPKDKVARIYVGATLPVKVAADNFDAVMFEWEEI